MSIDGDTWIGKHFMCIKLLVEEPAYSLMQYLRAILAIRLKKKIGPCQANLVLIAYASSEGTGEPAHPRSLAKTSAACSYKQ